MNEVEKAMDDTLNEDNPFKGLEAIGKTKIAPAHGIAALALNMALKYHDMCMIPDGATYQQYKLEGRNIRTIGLEDIFETAIKMEVYLLGASDRIAKVVIEALEVVVKDDEPSAETATEKAP